MSDVSISSNAVMSDVYRDVMSDTPPTSKARGVVVRTSPDKYFI